MCEGIGERYFEAIKKAWSPFSTSHRIIPFCTPVFERPTAIVIGTNHSDFVQGGGAEANYIANAFEGGVPNQNTFLVHNHKFANGLQRVCKMAGILIDDTWIGTNRCAVQAGPRGIKEIESNSSFVNCQNTMEIILREFLAEISPKNVLLVGKYASLLYYPDMPFANLKPRPLYHSGSAILIPIQHPSRASFWQPAAERLRECFISSPT